MYNSYIGCNNTSCYYNESMTQIIQVLGSRGTIIIQDNYNNFYGFYSDY